MDMTIYEEILLKHLNELEMWKARYYPLREKILSAMREYGELKQSPRWVKAAQVLDLAQAELRAMYKRLGINSSNALVQIDDLFTELEHGEKVDESGSQSTVRH